MTSPIGGVLTTNVYLGVEMFTTNCMKTAGHVWTVGDNTKKSSVTVRIIFKRLWSNIIRTAPKCIVVGRLILIKDLTAALLQ